MYRINLVTTSDITEFTNICQNIDNCVCKLIMFQNLYYKFIIGVKICQPIM